MQKKIISVGVFTAIVIWAQLPQGAIPNPLAALLTAKAIPFVSGPGAVTEDGTNFCYDSANVRLGVGTCSPTERLYLNHATRTQAAWALSSSIFGRITNANQEFSGQGSTDFGFNATNNLVLGANGVAGVKINSSGEVFGAASTTPIGFGDPTADGSWRFVRSGNNLVAQRRESGAWVTKQTFTP